MTPELIALHGFDPYADTGSLWGSIKSIGRTIGKGAKAAVHAVKSVSKIPLVHRALQAAETGLKNSGPWGMAANAALQAMGAGLQGKSLEEVAWAAAEGGTPSGIDRAISAAHAIRRGDNVIAVALSQAQQQFIPGSAASLGFDAAHRILKGQSVSKAALGTARRALPSEEARRAFDTAVGTASRAAAKGTTPMRALTTPNPLALLTKARAPFQAPIGGRLLAGHQGQQLVQRAIANNPALAAQSTANVARTLRMDHVTVARAMRSLRSGLSFAPLSSGAGAFVRRFAPFASTAALFGSPDTAGLSADGATYVVESGDSPWKVAQKLTGNGNNYRQLFTANPQYPMNADRSNFKNFWAGMVLKLPASWVKPATSTPLPAPSTSVTAQSSAAVLQAKATLAAWNATDGAASAGPDDYGLNPTDLSVDWGSRDKLMLSSFEQWSNARGGKLPTDGSLGPDAIDALRAWAEGRASAVIPVASAAPSATPAITPPAPSPAAPPAPIAVPAITLPQLTVSAPAPVLAPAAPPVTAPAPSAPAATAAPAGAPPVSSKASLAQQPAKGGDAFVPILIGAGVIAKALAFI